jgi:hypothetical protein
MSQIDLNSEQFQTLLGEALRAGPGSPAWREAVEQLRSAGKEGEEYTLLIRAREDLAAGRSYRQIKAGPGFTSKLMKRLDDAGKPSILPSAATIAWFSGIVVVIALGVLAYLLFSASDGNSVRALRDTYFVRTVISEDFQSPSEQFAVIGSSQPLFGSGLSPAPTTHPSTRSTAAARVRHSGVYCVLPLPPGKPFAVEVALELGKPDANMITQFFVTDQPSFTPPTGISPHEFSWLLQDKRIRILLPDGKTVAEAPFSVDHKSATIKLRMNEDSVIVEQGGKTIYAGPHRLGDRVRFIGVRFLSSGGEKTPAVSVKSLRVLQP